MEQSSTRGSSDDGLKGDWASRGSSVECSPQRSPSAERLRPGSSLSPAREPLKPFVQRRAATSPLGASRLRDYSVLVDASSSMRLVDARGKSRWEQAKEALEVLVPKVIARDEDGISLYFFSTGYNKFTLVNSADVVRERFALVRPKGGTQLTEALVDAFIPDNKGRPETILVITDGAPENRRSVEDAIVEAVTATKFDDDLRVVFVQVGTDAGASRWLSALDAALQCPPGVVQATTAEQLAESGLSLAQWVAQVVAI